MEALDLVFWPRTASEDSGERVESRDSPGPPRPHTSHSLPVSRSEAESMVEGKGFVERDLKLLENLRDAIVQNAAKRGRPRPTASHPQDHQPEAPER